jgi:hypothetical protein
LQEAQFAGNPVMIVRPRPHAAQLLYIMRGSIVPRIFPKVLAIAGLSLAVVWLHQYFPRISRITMRRPSRCWAWRFPSSSDFATTLASTDGGKAVGNGAS